MKTKGADQLWVILALLFVLLAESTTGITPGELAFLGLFMLALLALFHRYLKTDFRISDPTRLSVFIFWFLLSMLFVFAFSVTVRRLAVLDTARAMQPFLLISLGLLMGSGYAGNNGKFIRMAVFSTAVYISLKCIEMIVSNGNLLQNASLGLAFSPFNSPLYLFVIPFLLTSFILGTGHHRTLFTLGLFFVLWRTLIDFRKQPLLILIITVFLIIYFSRKDNMLHKKAISRIKIITPIAILLVLFGLFWGLKSLLENELLVYASQRLSPDIIYLGLYTRFTNAISAFNYFINNPVMGVGFGNAVDISGVIDTGSLTRAGRATREIAVSKVHNIYLYMLMSGGLFIFVPFMALMIKLLRVIRKNMKIAGISHEDYHWSLGSYILMVNFLILGLFSIRTLSMEAWFMLALAAYLAMSIRKKYKLRDIRS